MAKRKIIDFDPHSPPYRETTLARQVAKQKPWDLEQCILGWGPIILREDERVPFPDLPN